MRLGLHQDRTTKITDFNSIWKSRNSFLSEGHYKINQNQAKFWISLL